MYKIRGPWHKLKKKTPVDCGTKDDLVWGANDGVTVLEGRGCARRPCTWGREGLSWHEGETCSQGRTWEGLSWSSASCGEGETRGRKARGRGVGERSVMSCCVRDLQIEMNEFCKLVFIFSIKSNWTDRFFG